MTSARWERVKEIVGAALERAEPERSSYISGACENDEDLRREVESLLDADHAAHAAGGFMQTEAVRRQAAAVLNAAVEPTSVHPTTFSPDQVICDRFQIVRFLGRGGMGEVYEARDLHLRERVALKIVRPEIASDPKALARFNEEIRIARRVTHPNVCRIYDLEQCRLSTGSAEAPVSFLTMELLEGETLSSRLRRQGRMDPNEALPLIRQMAEGLAAAHRAGIIHRDFKPGNVMLVPERAGNGGRVLSNQTTVSVDAVPPASEPGTPHPTRAVITDFGLAKASEAATVHEGASSLTDALHLIGTPAYMAPEQLEHREATPATDVYALGLVMYEMATGRQPLPGDPYRRLRDWPPSPRVYVDEIDGRWELAIMRCLELDPRQRFAASDVAQVVMQVGRLGHWTPRHKFLAVAVACLVILIASVGLVSSSLGSLKMAVEKLQALFSHPSPGLTTSSSEARRRYLQACDLYAKQNWSDALNVANSALTLDPNFAMAHLLASRIYEQLGDGSKADEQLQLAMHSPARLTERERYLIQAMDYRSRNLDEKAAEQYRLVLDLSPGDLDALRGLAVTDYWVGRTGEAVASQRKALDITHSALDYKLLMDLLDRTNQFSEVIAIGSQARARGVDSPDLHFAVGLAEWGEDNVDAARKEFEILKSGGATYWQNQGELYVAGLLMYEGRVREGIAELRTGLVLTSQQGNEDWTPLYRFLLSRGLMMQGQLAQARTEAEELSREAVKSDDLDPLDLQRAGSLALALGSVPQARHLLSVLDAQRTQENSAFAQLQFFNLQGNVEVAEGNVDSAIESEKRASVFYSSFEPYLSLGKAYAARQDWGNAVEAYKRYIQFKGEILRDDFSPDWVLAHLQLARFYAKLGDRETAAQDYDECLQIWRNADPDLPDVRLARIERQSLF